MRKRFRATRSNEETATTAETLSITLPADMAQMIRRVVESGSYSCSSEVIRAKLRHAVDDPRRVTDDELGRHFNERLVEAEKTRKL